MIAKRHIVPMLLYVLPVMVRAEDIHLQIHAQPGQEFHYVLVTTQTGESRSVVSNMTVHDETEETQKYVLRVLENSNDTVLIEHRITAAAVKGHSNGLEVDYDSNRGDAQEQLSDSPAYQLSRSVGQAYQYRVDMYDRLLDAKDLERSVEAQGAGMSDHPVAEQILKSGLVQFGLATDLMAYPRWNMHPGDKWSTVSNLPLLGVVRLRMRHDYTFSGVALSQGRAVALVRSAALPEIESTAGQSLDQAVKVEFRDAANSRIDLATGLFVEEEDEMNSMISIQQSGGQGKLELKSHVTSKLTIQPN